MQFLCLSLRKEGRELIFSKFCGPIAFQFAKTQPAFMHSLKILIFVHFVDFTFVNHQKRPSNDFLQKRIFWDKLVLRRVPPVAEVQDPEEHVERIPCQENYRPIVYSFAENRPFCWCFKDVLHSCAMITLLNLLPLIIGGNCREFLYSNTFLLHIFGSNR